MTEFAGKKLPSVEPIKRIQRRSIKRENKITKFASSIESPFSNTLLGIVYGAFLYLTC